MSPYSLALVYMFWFNNFPYSYDPLMNLVLYVEHIFVEPACSELDIVTCYNFSLCACIVGACFCPDLSGP